MAHLQYFSYPGFGESAKNSFWYNQAVRVGDRIECSGQGGWDPETSNIPPDLKAEIDQAFANVDLTLKTAGGKGWSQVFRVNVYLVEKLVGNGTATYPRPLSDNEEGFSALVENLKKWMPDHQPILTVIGVKQLGLEGMRIEVEVVAHDPAI